MTNARSDILLMSIAEFDARTEKFGFFFKGIACHASTLKLPNSLKLRRAGRTFRWSNLRNQLHLLSVQGSDR